MAATGAGRPTTARAISGMIHPRRGRVMFGGRDVTGTSAERIAQLGLIHIPEGRGLFPNLSVEDTLRLVSNTPGPAGQNTPPLEPFPRHCPRLLPLVRSP